MILKPVQTITAQLVLLFSFSFGDEICDEPDLQWSIITGSRPIPSSGHWLVHNGRIVRKDVLEKQQLPAFRYIPHWKAFEEQALHDAPQRTTSPPEPEWKAPPLQKEYVSLKIFHWHLEADTYSQNSAERMNLLLGNIERHLHSAKLQPDIFAFTGTSIITGKDTQELLPDYPEKLCKILWKYRFSKEPNTKKCRMKRPDLKEHAMGRHNIFWTENMLIISMLPTKPFALPNYASYENCVLYTENSPSMSSYLYLDVQLDDYITPIMFFSSLDDSVLELGVIPDDWNYCWSVLKRDTDLMLTRNETMVIVSHLNAPYITYRDFARYWSAWVRKTEGGSQELNPKLAKPFFDHYRRKDNKDRRFSAILSYRRAREDMPQPAAHKTPDDIYLEPPGTRQKYLKWQGYSYFKPSYTEIKLDKARLPRTQ